MPARVLHLIETGGPGGAENVLIRLAAAAPSRGYEACVGLLRDAWLAEQLRERGIETWILPEPGRLDLGWYRDMARRIQDAGITAIHGHEFTMNVASGVLARSLRLPFAATVHGCNYWPDRWRRRMAYRGLARSGRLVAVSAETREMLRKTLGTAGAKVRTIANGIDPADYRPDAGARARVRAELGVMDDTVLIGAIGSLYPVKGHTHLITALSRLPGHEVRLFIAGRGGEQSALEAQIAEAGLADRVQLLGFRSDVPALLQAMDIFAMPSLSEGLPLSILEAMAAGRAIVASTVGGIPEAVADTARLAPPGDPDALAAALQPLIEDAALRGDLAARAQARVLEHYSLDATLRGYEQLYGIAP